LSRGVARYHLISAVMPDLPAPHMMRKHIFVICHAGLACTALDVGA